MCKGHRKVSKESDALYLEVVGEADGMDDGAWTDVDKCACLEMTIYKVEVNKTLATYNHTQAMVVDDEGGLLLHDETEHLWITMNYR